MNNQDGMNRSGVASRKQMEVAVLAGGCFWGVEDILRDVPGVIDTEVGYTGGWLENPRYGDTHRSKSGHAEAIRVTFDPGYVAPMHTHTPEKRSSTSSRERWSMRSGTKTCWRSGSSSCTIQPRSTGRVTTLAPNIDRRSFRKRLCRRQRRNE